MWESLLIVLTSQVTSCVCVEGGVPAMAKGYPGCSDLEARLQMEPGDRVLRLRFLLLVNVPGNQGQGEAEAAD